ncbi:f-box-like domain-containing protein [Staphylotrichum tortipilum]|uniref:F-box-like domain-containing protein n=1 Tax=Staphylotrichum tortipilum TaxID=2831512 RepID=A0AAN6MAU8_9PEZI|nr:f-box-like domain-containing protein [Staphylotrichum longicolle]
MPVTMPVTMPPGLETLPVELFLRVVEQHPLTWHEPGRLPADSWDLGTCVPSQVLGPRGIVPRKHPLLRSLSLATDPNCHIDLSSFAELRSLCWISPHPAHLRTLSAALSQNSARLQHLELSFGSWRRFIRNWTKHEDDDELQRLCASRLFGLTVQSPQPIIFPAISTLSLTGVPLRVGMADALGVNTLRSLTIRGCPGWREFLKRVAESGLPMQLKAFQICDRDGQDPDNGLGHTVIGDFLGAFEGLEELFISHHGAEHALELWRHVAHHRVTLKNFVYHRRAVSLGGDDSFSSLYPHDVPDLGILPEDMCRMEESPLKNPLAALDLNFMGLCCVPQRLKPILLPFTSKTSLKVLHIRQSTTLLKAFEVPWALSMDPLKRYGLPLASPQSGSVNPIEWAAGEADGLDSANNTTTDRTDADDPSSRKPNRKPKLRPEFRQFAEWVFGPHGVRSLQLLVCGNYANDDWLRQVVLERSPGGEGNGLFRDPIVGSHRPKSVEAYRDLFEVCRVVGDWDRPQG